MKINKVKNSIQELNVKTIDIGEDTTYEIRKSSDTALINEIIDSNLALRPKLIINDYKRGTKVLSNIERELVNCKEFMISVAFITESGITPLLQVLKELEEKGIRGRILTTNYLNFSEPKALKKLLTFSNIKVKMYQRDNFHTKGYIFKHEDYYKVIVGSSNMTQNALTRNKEWNIEMSSLKEGELTNCVVNEFEAMWKDADVLNMDLLNTYEEIYLKQREITRKTRIPNICQYKLTPNKMQLAAMNSLKALREKGENKALLISATGTGKTYLSAFDMRSFNPKRALFVVHREHIARQALKSFSNVFGDTKSFGILSGGCKEKNKDIIFSTVQTLSKDEVLNSFSRDEFDYIIIDEVHRAGAETYQKVVSYFEPEFFLGMSATPERTDDFDIFKMFDYNIAYEIRLNDAMEENLLCPFHYFGISDVCVDGIELQHNSDFKYLVSEERVKHIIDRINYYGYSGDRVHGLLFCSTKKEARALSEMFNSKGFRTIALTGENSEKERENAILRLEQEEYEGGLDYIFTVDIFNEGVDIPKVNQVVMLRPTTSSIVFVQQLGRGLRKAQYKEFVVVIDFVANYDKNYLIPIALSGDKTYNKDNIRKYLLQGNKVIPGCSTINFDEVTRKKIYEAIDAANFNDVRLIRESYRQLKNKLGRIPTLMDFEEHGEIDVLRIFDNKSLGSYYKFLKKYEKDYVIKLNLEEEKYIEFISKKLANGKRVHELELIKGILNEENDLIAYLKTVMKEKYDVNLNLNSYENIFNVMTNEFPSGTGKETYGSCIFIEGTKDSYNTSSRLKKLLKNEEFSNMMKELVNFGIYRNEKYYGNKYEDTAFQLYSKYTYEDVCRLLEWEKAEVALNIGGYKYDKKTKTYPVFINYDKNDDIADTIKYEDRLISPSTLVAISKSGRTLKSEDVYTALHGDELGVKMDLFIRKNKDDKISKEFYYMGRIHATGKAEEFKMPNTNKNAVEIYYSLQTPIRDDLYEYIIS